MVVENGIVGWRQVESNLKDRVKAAVSRISPGMPASEPALSSDAQRVLDTFVTPVVSVDRSPLSTEEQRLLRLQNSNLLAAARELSRFGSKAAALNEVKGHLLKQIAKSPNKIKRNSLLVNLNRIKHAQKNLQQEQLQIASKSPEAFFLVHGRTFRRLVNQLCGGRIAKTPYVEEQINRVRKGLATNTLVLLHGETGSGKTEVAKIVGQLLGKGSILVSGYKGIGSHELFGHNVLHESNGATVSRFVLGPVYEAASKGQILIIDEGNYVPPPLLAKLNNILTKRPGETVNVQEDGCDPITVAPGFGVIVTGNINLGTGGRYKDRFEFDTAFRDRAAVIEHSVLPQAVEGRPEQHSFEDKQLFAVILAKLAAGKIPNKVGAIRINVSDRVGTLLLPGGESSLDILWRFAQFATVTCKAFAGELDASSPFCLAKGGVTAVPKPEISLSPRAVIRILESWERGGFANELDYHIHAELSNGSLKAIDRAYFYQLGQKFGFFASPGWEQSPDYGCGNFVVKAPDNMSAELEFVSGAKIITAIFGEPPERSVWPDSNVSHSAASDQEGVNDFMCGIQECDALGKESDQILGAYRSFLTDVACDTDKG